MNLTSKIIVIKFGLKSYACPLAYFHRQKNRREKTNSRTFPRVGFDVSHYM